MPGDSGRETGGRHADTGLSTFNTTVEKTNRILREIEDAFGWPKERRSQSFAALRAVLHALRDRLPVDEAAQLGAQLPMLVRGICHEGWDPSKVPIKMHREDFLERMRRDFPYDVEGGIETLVTAVLNALRHHISEGEWRTSSPSCRKTSPACSPSRRPGKPVARRGRKTPKIEARGDGRFLECPRTSWGEMGDGNMADGHAITSRLIGGRRWRAWLGLLVMSGSLAILPAAPAGAAPLVTEDLTGPLTAEELVADLVGGGVTVSNVVYTGAEVAAGKFSGGAGVIGFGSGIILGSGAIDDVIGPNTLESTSTNNGTPGDADLTALAGGNTFDAAVLEFDFVPVSSTLTFDYVFTSEEYNEFVNTGFNDVFAFFVNGENCATVGGEPVSVNTINNGNPFGTPPVSNPGLYKNNDLASGAPLDTEMDGLTTVLTCEASVDAGETNHIKLAVADTGDSIYDANVFLGAETFVAAPPAFNFWAPLSSGSEVPPVPTDGAGVVGMSVNDADTVLSLMLATYNLEDIVAAHIHCGAAGVNGDVGVTLFDGGPVTGDGLLVQTTITAPDPGNGCGWANLGDVLEAMRTGGAYVNVHTVAYPGGEIRGQVEAFIVPPAGSGTFVDDDGNIHEGNIEAIAAPEITKGCNPPANDAYCPGNDITRGQMAAFLRRTFNLPKVTVDLFTDDDDSEFEDDINSIAAVGITLGCNPPANDQFCPTNPVTRGQMGSFLVRALALTAGAGDDLFVDDDTSVHETDIDILGTAGITLGCNPPANDQFCPNDPVKRDQMGSFFARFLEFRPMIP